MLDRLIVENGMPRAGDRRFACHLGRAGTTADKREGDHKTPIGSFALRRCYYRPDRVAPPDTQLPVMALTHDDGWCDDAAHPLYNRPVKLPFAASHERLWRDDRAYDLIVPLGYNDAPPVAGKGSAIFLHLTRPDGAGTEGCVALDRADLLALLPQLGAETMLEVVG